MKRRHWNFRVLAEEDKHGEPWLEIHEVYYDNEGIPNSYTTKAVDVSAETLKGLKWRLKHMKRALKQPILWKGDMFPQEYSKGWVTTKGIISTITNEEKI